MDSTDNLQRLAERLNEASSGNVHDYKTLVRIDGRAVWTLVHAESEDRALVIAKHLYGKNSILQKPKRK